MTSHKPSCRLPLLSARPVVTFPAEEHTSTKLYCLVTEAHVCEQLAQGRYMKVELPGIEPTISGSRIQCPNHYTTVRPSISNSSGNGGGSRSSLCRL